MEQTAGVFDVTDCRAVAVGAADRAVKPPPKVPLAGRFVMVGVVGCRLRNGEGLRTARSAA